MPKLSGLLFDVSVSANIIAIQHHTGMAHTLKEKSTRPIIGKRNLNC